MSKQVNHLECMEFLFTEAALLDDQRLKDWLQLLAPDIDYKVPVRVVREKGKGFGFSEDAFYMKEDFGTLNTRIKRFDSEFAWAETPPTRTRRLVGNIRMTNGHPGGGDEETRVLSNLAVYCYRGDTPAPIVLTAERHDMLRRDDGALKLVNRVVLLDSTVLGLQALSIFL
ncbi:MAG: phenylpropionate dioxygenase [Actinobacteria bacterium]|nr:phenylpropionate dioxygenase [Actinomycetota bacterium]